MKQVDTDLNKQAEKISKIIKKDASFLKDFKYEGFSQKNKMNLWKFMHEYPDYKYRIIFGEKDDKWKVKIFVYWRNETKNPTITIGKDYDYETQFYNSFSTLIDHLDKRLKSNPIMGTHLYNDDNEENMVSQAVPMLIELKKKGDILMKIKNPQMKDLQKIYKEIKNIPDSKLLQYCKVKFQKEYEKQDLLFDLQKLSQIDYYYTIQTTHLAKHEINKS